MNNDSRKYLNALVYTSLSIAMVTLLTMVIKIPSVKGGYVNFGDTAIFITAVLMGKRAGFFAGSIGSALADILLGYGVYAPATFVIKGLEGFICGFLIEKKKDWNNIYTILAMALSAAWMVFGYFMFEYKIGSIFFGNENFGITAAAANLTGNIIQGSVSTAAALPFIIALKKTKLPFNLSR